MKHIRGNNAWVLLLLMAMLLIVSCEKMILGPQESIPPKTTIQSSKLAGILDSFRIALDLPAIAGAIVTDTGVIEARAVGCRRYLGPANVTVNDQFHLGSNTKAITAVLIGILIDQKLLDWTTTLPEIFPEYAASMRSEYEKVTVLDLLSHSSGFMRDPIISWDAESPYEKRVKMVSWALGQPPAIERGKFLYSNLGYAMLGAIAEKLTNRPYEEILIEKVLQPLGINSAGFGAMGNPGLEDQPLQHTDGRSPIEPTAEADLDPVYSPAGRLHMNILDWAKYIRWVLAAEAGHQSLVSAKTANILTTPLLMGDGGVYYACGWNVYNTDWAGGKTISHNGTNGYNYSVAALAPNKHFAVIAATNVGPGKRANPIDPVAWRLIQLYLNKR